MQERNSTCTSERHDVQRFTDDMNQPVVRVPLNNDGSIFALADEADYNRVRAENIGGLWYVNGDGKGWQYVRTGVPHTAGHQIMVARAILRAGAGEAVTYANGNHLDIRRRNLSIRKGCFASKRCDALLALRSREMRQEWNAWGRKAVRDA